MRSLLKAKGITSESVLINSSNAYTLTQVPTFFQLDHVITFVPQFGLYLDSNTSATPFGVLPFAEYGKPAVFVSADAATLGRMPVLQPGIAAEHTNNVMKLSATGVLTGTTTTTAEGPSSILLRLIGLATQAIGAEKAAATELEAHGYKGATGRLIAGPPLVPGNSYTVTGNFSSPGWADWLSGQKVAYMPIGLRVLGVVGDGPMGTVSSITGGETGPTPCYSVHQWEDDSLEIPANARFEAVPTDTKVVTDNIQFTSHWSLNNNTLTVHRDFASHIDQPLCTGAVRQKTVRALLEIALSYLTQIRIVPSSGAPALVSQNTAPMGPAPVGSPAALAYNDAATKLADSEKATQLIKQMLATNSSETPKQTYVAHLMQGLAYLQNSQLSAAVSELSEAIRLNPEAGSQPYSARASAYSKMGKNRLAAADLDTALKAAPDDVELRQKHAEALVGLKDYDGAAADYNVIVRDRPDDVGVILARAGIRYHADKYDEAAADYRHAVRLGASEDDTRPGLCNSTARTDEFANALAACNWTLAHDAHSGAALESRGYTYFRLGKYAEALDDFGLAAKLYPQNLHYLYERGVAELKTGKAAEGKRDIDAATKLDARISHRVPEKMAL